VSRFIYYYTECHYAECRNAECRGALSSVTQQDKHSSLLVSFVSCVENEVLWIVHMFLLYCKIWLNTTVTVFTILHFTRITNGPNKLVLSVTLHLAGETCQG
jgi:hypothetical protein